jgi:sugar/nucleoside kinase (ribokinase family)
MSRMFWERLRRFATGVHLDSVSVGFATISFSAVEVHTPSFSNVTERLAKADEKTSDVLAVSAHNVDEITVVDRVDADHECEALDSPLRVAGGSGANTAYALARLGASVRVSGAVGQDSDGAFLRKELSEVGVDVEMLCSTPELPTGRTTTLVERGGKRFIVVLPGANNHFARSVGEDGLFHAALSSRIVHLSSFVGMEELQLQQRLVQKVGSRSLVSLTPGALYARQGLDRLESILRHVDIMFLYREQLEQLIDNSSAGASAKAKTAIDLLEVLFSWRRRNSFDSPVIIVVKDPVESASGKIHERFLSVGVGCQSLEKTFRPQLLQKGAQIDAVDLTGSGDAAAAGFLFGLLNSAPLEACIDLSFLMAGFVARELGARTALQSNIAQLQGRLPDALRSRLST